MAPPPPRPPRGPYSDAELSRIPSSPSGSGPGSMWSAPQSHIPPPKPPSQREPSEQRVQTYLRRVTQPHRFDGPKPTPLQRTSQLLAGGLSFVALVWSVLWQDFGDREHCFSPIRRLAGTHSIPIFKDLFKEDVTKGVILDPALSYSPSPSSETSSSSSISSSSSSSSKPQQEEEGGGGGNTSLIESISQLLQRPAKVTPPTSSDVGEDAATQPSSSSASFRSHDAGHVRENVEEAARRAVGFGQGIFGVHSARRKDEEEHEGMRRIWRRDHSESGRSSS